MPAPLRSLCLCLLGLLIFAVPHGALAQKVKLKQPKMLQQLQEDYSKAIRWNDFEGAWTVLDPAYREANPITDAEFSRYEQIQVTAFEDLDSRVLPDGSVERAVRIELVNRHTLSQRSLRFTEVWRYDPTTKRWWLSSGLPNFWEGR
ncbi:MAG: hypothetical protein KA144_03705 [Xanthomonadaceae bacterium]|nr:hypothetical protein [Xanthomonadaceae bacterium]